MTTEPVNDWDRAVTVWPDGTETPFIRRTFPRPLPRQHGRSPVPMNPALLRLFLSNNSEPVQVGR